MEEDSIENVVGAEVEEKNKYRDFIGELNSKKNILG